MLAVKNQTLINTAETPGVNVNKVADLALSDVFPGSASPPIPDSAFDRTVVGVVPFVFVKNNSLAGVTNITRDQALLLMTASGAAGMPATYLGGISTNEVYLIGRDSGSGTRISVEKDIGFSGTPLLWATNATGGLITTNGYSSGGLVRNTVNGTVNSIGYMSLGDAILILANTTSLNYNGVPYAHTNVANGSYALWGYEHLVNRVGGLSANQALIRDAIIGAITEPGFQSTNLLYAPNFVSLVDMQVERGADGGPITSKNF
jgi:phosphate transport system substrate-binding protein